MDLRYTSVEIMHNAGQAGVMLVAAAAAADSVQAKLELGGLMQAGAMVWSAAHPHVPELQKDVSDRV